MGAVTLKDPAEKYSAPALDKGLDVLELLASEPGGITKSEIARLLNRTISEIFRMLVVLERRGYIFADQDSDKYALTLKLFQLSHRFPPIRRLSMVSAGIMQKLAFETRKSCHVVVYFSGSGHVVAQQDSPTDVIYAVRLGVEVDLLNSCSGRVLLSFASDELRERMLHEVKMKGQKFSAAEVKSLVGRIREQGYETIDSPRVSGAIDFSYPVFDHNGQVIAALTVPYLSRLDSEGVSPDVVMAALRAASREISLGLGYAPPE